MAHYYKPDGTAAHFEGKGGKPTTLREARKLNLFPSVTTIVQDVLNKPGLIEWYKRQAILAALTLPRNEGETDASFVDRVLSDSVQEAADAAHFGMAAHHQIEKRQGPYWDGLLNEMSSGGIVSQREFTQEVGVVGSGWAGRFDILLEVDGLKVLVDFKGREWADKPPRPHDDWIYQLGGYHMALAEAGTFPNQWVSAMFNRAKEGEWHWHVWDEEDINRGCRGFLHMFELWKIIKKYDPMVVPE